jgi:hypothetical protein
MNNIFYNLSGRRKQRSWGGGQEKVPHFVSDDQETPCPQRQKNEGTGEMVHHLTGKLFPQVHDAKKCSPSSPETITGHCSFFGKERTDNYAFH